MMPGRPVGCQCWADEVESVLPCVGRTEFGLGLGGGELGGAAVDDDGLAGFGGDVHLGGEGQLLDGDVGVFEVVVVETDFADGDAFGIGGEAGYFGEGLASVAWAASRGWMPALA